LQKYRGFPRKFFEHLLFPES